MSSVEIKSPSQIVKPLIDDYSFEPEDNVPTPVDQNLPEHPQQNLDDERMSYSTRIRNTPGYLNDYVCTNIGYLCTLSNCVIPNTYEEAVTCLESMKWKQAMENEIEAFIDNHTFTKVSKSENMNTVGGRWLYTIKDDPNNEEIFKAHYVAKGYSQIYGKDYHETFALTAKMISLRILMQISAHKNLHIHQMDVKTAYLNAPVYCDIYLEPPEGHRDDNNIWKLNKSLYGLKQTCRNWNIMIHDFSIRFH